jgi:hypothetical protein
MITGRYQVTIYGGSATVQIAAIPVDTQQPLTWIGATSVTAAALTGTGVTFTAEFGQGHLVRVTGAGTVKFGRIPTPVTNAA